MPTDVSSGRRHQKQRTRGAIVDAARDLVTAGDAPTMPAVARAARVSEATAYRYFPDLAALLQEVVAGVSPSPEEVMAPVADEQDVTARIAFATRALMEEVRTHEAAVRVMMSAAVARPSGGRLRPGRRFGLLAIALEPLAATRRSIDPEGCAQLERDLAVVVSAEAYFTLTDLCGLTPEQAVVSAVHTATTLTRAAVAAGPGAAARPSAPGC